jgi:hypothetical protein
MSVLNRIAYYQNRRDEVPNQELARDLAAANDREGVHEIAENLWNKDKNIQSDCLKTLYETGYLKPELIADYTADFLRLLHDKNNRLVWGSMTALAAIAELRADEIYPHSAEIEQIMEQGSVITMDNGVKTLAGVASSSPVYSEKLFPYLLEHLRNCRSKEVPQHAEKILIAVNGQNKVEFIATLEKRLADMTPSQVARVKKVIKAAEKKA